MIFFDDKMVDIPVLEGKSLSVDSNCSAIAPIISNGIFLYVTELTVDLVVSLSVLILLSAVGSCSPATCECMVDGIRYASIFLNSLSVWYSFILKPLLVCWETTDWNIFSISFLPQLRNLLVVP